MITEGWSYLSNSPKWHYFTEDRRSLCGKWMLLFGTMDDLEQGNDDSPDNCKACAKKVKSRKLKALNGAVTNGNGHKGAL